MKLAAALVLSTAVFAACGAPAVSPSPAPTAAAPTATAPATAPWTVYFARDRLAPVAVEANGPRASEPAAARVRARLIALRAAPAVGPGTSVNLVRVARVAIGDVRVDAATAYLDLLPDPKGWGLDGPGYVGMFVQQLVWTATQDGDADRVVITQNGGERAWIDGVAYAAALTRQDTLWPVGDRDVVYVARDLGLPVAVHVDGAGAGATAAERVRSRLGTLATRSFAMPEGAFNAVAGMRASLGTVTVAGDLAVADYVVDERGWGVDGSSRLRAFIQQLVFTATEEPGVSRFLITENGARAVIGGEGLIVDRPISRAELLAQ